MTDHLGKEMPYSHLLQFLCFFAFIITWVVDTLFLSISKELNDSIHIIFRVFAFVITLIFGYYLMRKVHEVALDESTEEERKLITTGVFSRIRHPLYLGTMMFYLSFIFLYISLLSIIVFVFIAIIYDILARYEEKDLVRLLGSEYEDYIKKSSRWIPYIY